MSEQLRLFEAASDTNLVSIAHNDSEHKRKAIQRYLDRGEKENDCYVNQYYPGKRATKYFRLSYRQGKKMKHIHIPGGNTLAELAQYRAKKLQEMINRGAELGEVIAAVKTYRSGAK
jgi:hypothetical protein